MCLAVYIASPSTLPLVAWHEKSPSFYVEEAEAGDPVRVHFPWSNVYYAGSHEGCGCGFAYGQMPEGLEDPEDEARRRSSVAALRQYLVDAAVSSPVHLFACWEGEQSHPEKDRVEVTVDVLDGASFKFEQLRLMVFPARTPA